MQINIEKEMKAKKKNSIIFYLNFHNFTSPDAEEIQNYNIKKRRNFTFFLCFM